MNEDFDGLQTYVNGTIPVVAYNERKSNKPDRVRFTLLHEAMLLPEETIKAELGNHRTKLSTLELGNIKKQYGISMQAVVMRAKVCGIINENYTKQFFFLIRQQN